MLQNTFCIYRLHSLGFRFQRLKRQTAQIEQRRRRLILNQIALQQAIYLLFVLQHLESNILYTGGKCSSGFTGAREKSSKKLIVSHKISPSWTQENNKLRLEGSEMCKWPRNHLAATAILGALRWEWWQRTQPHARQRADTHTHACVQSYSSAAWQPSVVFSVPNVPGSSSVPPPLSVWSANRQLLGPGTKKWKTAYSHTLTHTHSSIRRHTNVQDPLFGMWGAV